MDHPGWNCRLIFSGRLYPAKKLEPFFAWEAVGRIGVVALFDFSGILSLLHNHKPDKLHDTSFLTKIYISSDNCDVPISVPLSAA
jgi:hypothetical protein